MLAMMSAPAALGVQESRPYRTIATPMPVIQTIPRMGETTTDR